MATLHDLRIYRQQQPQPTVESTEPSEQMPSVQTRPQHKNLDFSGGSARWVRS